MTRGEPRDVHPFQPRCRSSWLSPGFPDRDTDSSAPPSLGLRRAKLQWRLTCTGQRTERRTRLRPSMRGESLLVVGACASKSACGRRSLPWLPLDTRCRRCGVQEGRRPLPSDGPTKGCVPTTSREGRRHPEARDAFHRSRRRDLRRGSLHATSRVGPSLTPPTRSPQIGERCLHGPCKLHPAVTRDAWTIHI